MYNLKLALCELWEGLHNGDEFRTSLYRVSLKYDVDYDILDREYRYSCIKH